jgi:hypothetical protein
VGLSGVGLAFCVGASSFRALRKRDRPAAQASHRMGLAASYVGEALVPRHREIVAVADSTYASLKRSSSTDVVEGSPIRLPSSLACAWTPPSTSQPHHVVPVK